MLKIFSTRFARLLPVCLSFILGALIHSALLAQEEPTPTPIPVPILTMNVGETLDVTVPASAATAGVAVSLNVEEAALLTISVANPAGDVANPQFTLLNSTGRELLVIDDNPGAVSAVGATDAVYENFFLIPDRYILVVQRSDTEPVEAVFAVSAQAGPGELPGLGTVDIIEAELEPGTRYRLPITLARNDYLSVAALGSNNNIDLQLRLLNAEGGVELENDDNTSTSDFLLDFIDPKLEQAIVPADGDYIIEVGAYTPEEAGTFKLIVTRFGSLDESDARVEIFSGDSLFRGRTTFTFEGQAGEVITVTARAAGSSLDPEIQLLDPDMIFIASNDDHQSEATDLAELDARVANLMLQKTGSYTLEINSVGGRGPFEVTLERFGRFVPVEYSPLETDGAALVTIAEDEIADDDADPDAADEGGEEGE